MELVETVEFDDETGLVPAVVQDAGDGRVLMLAYMNRRALERTLEGGRVTFWSRSRRELWEKGATSGNWLEAVEVRTDCDHDALLVRARPHGPACHTGEASCFEAGRRRRVDGARSADGGPPAPAGAAGRPPTPDRGPGPTARRGGLRATPTPATPGTRAPLPAERRPAGATTRGPTSPGPGGRRPRCSPASWRSWWRWWPAATASVRRAPTRRPCWRPGRAAPPERWARRPWRW